MSSYLSWTLEALRPDGCDHLFKGLHTHYQKIISVLLSSNYEDQVPLGSKMRNPKFVYIPWSYKINMCFSEEERIKITSNVDFCIK